MVKYDLRPMYTLKEFKEKFDPLLLTYTKTKVENVNKNTSNQVVADIVSYCTFLISHGGKRIRPYLAYVMYVAKGGKDIDAILEILAAIEVFHIFALVHDDVMDRSLLRHGIKTIQNFTEEKLIKEKRKGDLLKVGESQGILAGDLLLAWSLEVFTTNNKFPKENLEKAHDYFFKMADEVILGQMLDIDITTRENPSQELIEEKTRLKTSRYSFVRPMEIGAALATTEDIEDFCENLGTNLGLTFQLQDDLLDIIADPELIHKNIMQDLMEGQHTFFTNFILERGTKEQTDRLNLILGRNIKKEEQKEIQDFFYSTGAIDEGKKIIEQGLKNADKIVSDSKLGEESKLALTNLIDSIRQRSVT